MNRGTQVNLKITGVTNFNEQLLAVGDKLTFTFRHGVFGEVTIEVVSFINSDPPQDSPPGMPQIEEWLRNLAEDGDPESLAGRCLRNTYMALHRAREEGRRAGLEEAAALVERLPSHSVRFASRQWIAKRLRSLSAPGSDR